MRAQGGVPRHQALVGEGRGEEGYLASPFPANEAYQV